MARRPSSVRPSVCPSVNFCANRFFSQANVRIATKLGHDGLQVNLHPGCAQGQGQGQRSRDTGTFWILGMSYSVIDGLVMAQSVVCTVPTNGGDDVRFPAESSSQFVLHGCSILPALEESAELQCGDVDIRWTLDAVLDGAVERRV